MQTDSKMVFKRSTLGIQYTDEVMDFIEAWDGKPAFPQKESWKKARMTVLKNPFLERWIAEAHPITPIVWFGPLAAYGVYLGLTGMGLLPTLSLFAFGILAWTLGEYLVHRFLFHAERLNKTPRGKVALFMMHGYHHEFPNDKMRLVAPPFMSWSFGIVVFALYYSLLGPVSWGPLFSGTIVGYVAYDWIHYYCHHFRPKGGVGKFLRDYHLEHHFKDPHLHYGVSSPLWDIIVAGLTRGRRWQKPVSAD